VNKFIFVTCIFLFLIFWASATQTDEYILLGKGYERTGEYDLALVSYDHAISADPSNVMAHQAKISLLKHTKRIDEAKEADEEQIRCLCDNGDYKGSLLWKDLRDDGIEFLSKCDYSNAEKKFKEIHNLCSQDRLAIKYLELIKNKDNAEAVKQIVLDNRDLFSDNNIQRWLSQEIGDVLKIEPTKSPKSGSPASGKNDYVKGSLGSSPNVAARNLDGNSEPQYLDNQLSTSTQSQNLIENESRNGAKLNESEKSCSCQFQIKPEQNIPSDAILNNNLGADQYSKKDYLNALNSFTQALAIAPNYGTAYKNKGQIQVLLGDYHQSQDTFTNVINNFDPDDYCVYNNRGFAFYKSAKSEINTTLKIQLLEKAIVDFDFGLIDVNRDYPGFRNETIQKDIDIINQNRRLALYELNLLKPDDTSFGTQTQRESSIIEQLTKSVGSFINSVASSAKTVGFIVLLLILGFLLILVFKKLYELRKDVNEHRKAINIGGAGSGFEFMRHVQERKRSKK